MGIVGVVDAGIMGVLWAVGATRVPVTTLLLAVTVCQPVAHGEGRRGAGAGSLAGGDGAGGEPPGAGIRGDKI